MFVYRFIDKLGEIIYIGKTKTGIKRRMSQHFSKNGHLPKDCYNETVAIEYLKLKSKIDMDIRELYYINKWKPKFNKKDKQNEILNVVIDESKDYWLLYDTKNENYLVKEKYNTARSHWEYKAIDFAEKRNYLDLLMLILKQNKDKPVEMETIKRICEVSFVKFYYFFDDTVYDFLTKHNVTVESESLTLNT